MPATETPPPVQYQFLLPVWGEKYVQTCLRFMLPSHAANVAALPAADTLLRIFTRTPDMATFRASPAFRQHAREYPVSFESIDDLHLVKENPYGTMTACHERALATAPADAAFVFLNPDAVYSDGSYAAILRHFRRGKRAVMVQGLRASLPDFAAAVDALRPPAGDWPPLPPRALARIALDALHPLSVAHIVEHGDTGNKSVGSYYWRVGADGLVCRCIHTHPLAVRPLRPVSRLFTTVDHEYVRWSCPDADTVHLVTDSDEMIVVEISDPAHLAEWVKGENVPDDDILAWMQEWTNEYHRAAFTRSFVVHAGPVSPAFEPVERAAAAFADRILGAFARRHPDAGPEQFNIARAIRWEREAAERERARTEADLAAEAARRAVEQVAADADARIAEEARVAAVARAAEAQATQATRDEAARAGEAARRAAEAARRAADALRAARAAPSAPPAPEPPSLPGRVWGAVRKLSVKAHRQFNRPLYNRQDQLTERVTRLGEQRRIDDHRLTQLTAWLHNEEASRTADVLRQSEVLTRHADAARMRFESLEQQFDITRQKTAHHEHQIAAIERLHESDRQLVSGAFDGLSAAVRAQLDAQQRNLTDVQRQLTADGHANVSARLDNLQRRWAESQTQQAAFQQQWTESHHALAASIQQLTAGQQELAGALQAAAHVAANMRLTHDRLLQMLSLTGVINFADRDTAMPSLQPPLGYSDYDMATFVYRPAFERAIRYLQGNDLAGCVAEFGTYRGFTAQTFAEMLRNTQWPAKLYLYDSFAGLPAPVGNDADSYEVRRRGVWLEGAMAPEPDIVANIRASIVGVIGEERLAIHPGFFEDSLPVHPPAEPVAILHVDADLYLSARFVLQYLADAKLIVDGAVLLMDDFNCNAANPTMGERKALTDFLADNPAWTASPWFAYGWHGQAFFLHAAVGR